MLGLCIKHLTLFTNYITLANFIPGFQANGVKRTFIAHFCTQFTYRYIIPLKPSFNNLFTHFSQGTYENLIWMFTCSCGYIDVSIMHINISSLSELNFFLFLFPCVRQYVKIYISSYTRLHLGNSVIIVITLFGGIQKGDVIWRRGNVRPFKKWLKEPTQKSQATYTLWNVWQIVIAP